MRSCDIKVRIAINEDGEAIKKLAEARGFCFDGFDVDWSDIWPFWLVADRAGEVVGAIQTCPSKPIGRIEFLVVRDDLNLAERGVASKLLTTAAEALIREQGSQLAAGTISYKNACFCVIAEKRGWSVMSSGTMVLKRLR